MARPRVFLDISIGAQPAGRLTIELFTDQTPITCENFRLLCTGEKGQLATPTGAHDLCYKNTTFHRIISEFMIQGGDLTSGDGTGGLSTMPGGVPFEDENIGWREISEPGLVCMANRGKVTNTSQFFITLTDCTHLTPKHTVFGRLVSGHDVLRRLETLPVDSTDHPLDPVIISNCGELMFKKKDPAAAPTQISHKETTDSHAEREGRHRSHRRRRSRDAKRPRSSEDADADAHTTTATTSRGRSRSRRSGDGVIAEEPEEAVAEVMVKRSHSRSRERSRERSRPRQRRRHHEKPRRRERERERVEYERDEGAEERIRREEEERERGRFEAMERDGDNGGRERERERERVPEVKFKGRGSMKYREKKNWGWGGGEGRLS